MLPVVSSGQLHPAGSQVSPGPRSPREPLVPPVQPGNHLDPSRTAAMLREEPGPAGGILETIPLDGSSALRMLTLGRYWRSPSALSVSKNAKMLPQAANMADQH